MNKFLALFLSAFTAFAMDTNQNTEDINLTKQISQMTVQKEKIDLKTLEASANSLNDLQDKFNLSVLQYWGSLSQDVPMEIMICKTLHSQLSKDANALIKNYASYIQQTSAKGNKSPQISTELVEFAQNNEKSLEDMILNKNTVKMQFLPKAKEQINLYNKQLMVYSGVLSLLNYKATAEKLQQDYNAFVINAPLQPEELKQIETAKSTVKSIQNMLKSITINIDGKTRALTDQEFQIVEDFTKQSVFKQDPSVNRNLVIEQYNNKLNILSIQSELNQKILGIITSEGTIYTQPIQEWINSLKNMMIEYNQNISKLEGINFEKDDLTIASQKQETTETKY